MLKNQYWIVKYLLGFFFIKNYYKYFILKSEDEWLDHCQLILKANSGINFKVKMIKKCFIYYQEFYLYLEIAYQEQLKNLK